jgi:outer membrane protein OmpA-like peptidoglycan-associated protein
MKTTIITTSLAAILLVTIAASKNNVKTKATVNSSISAKAIPLAELTKNIEYDFDKPAVKDKYYSNLNQLAEAIKNEKYLLTLRGHADSIGEYKYNWMLSDRRALSVKKYLVSKGIAENRIVTSPFGSTIPIATNKTAAGRQKNRRVEIRLKKVS